MTNIMSDQAKGARPAQYNPYVIKRSQNHGARQGLDGQPWNPCIGFISKEYIVFY